MIELISFITAELKEDPQCAIKKVFEEEILMPSPRPGKAVAHLVKALNPKARALVEVVKGPRDEEEE